jgi:hypothetical protein
MAAPAGAGNVAAIIAASDTVVDFARAIRMALLPRHDMAKATRGCRNAP